MYIATCNQIGYLNTKLVTLVAGGQKSGCDTQFIVCEGTVVFMVRSDMSGKSHNRW